MVLFILGVFIPKYTFFNVTAFATHTASLIKTVFRCISTAVSLPLQAIKVEPTALMGGQTINWALESTSEGRWSILDSKPTNLKLRFHHFQFAGCKVY